MISVTLPNGLMTALYDLEEAVQAQGAAREASGEIYCWKTSGKYNWLERGLSVADVLGLVVLSAGLPEYMDMPDDDVEP